MLLVSGAGESTYRFSLHGAALLGDGVEGKNVQELKKIYRARSGMAHGSMAADVSSMQTAVTARRFLAEVIWAVVQRINDGSLEVGKTDGNIGKAVELLVQRLVLQSSISGAIVKCRGWGLNLKRRVGFHL